MATSDVYMMESVYEASLAGQHEVPPVDTHARGSALIRKVGSTRVSYALSVSGLKDITEAHIHKGRPGRNGPIVAWLFGPSPGKTVSGLLARGVIKRDDLVGPLSGKSIKSLVRLMNEGKAYVNVHTRRHPQGEIRGQIRASGRRAVQVSNDWWREGGMTLM